MEGEPDTLYSVAIWHTRVSYEQALVSAWEAFARWTIRRQQGVQAMRLLRDDEEPQRLIAVGIWRSREDIARWQETPEYQAFMMEVRLLCDEQEERRMILAGEVILSAEANGPGR